MASLAELDRVINRVGAGGRVGEVVAAQADRLMANPELAAVAMWAPLTPPFELAAARDAIAKEHRFASWAEARACDRIVDPRFEAACDAIIQGDVAALAALVDRELVTARSAYAHRATLLHHVAANGIESARQWQSPATAAAIAQVLVDAGADPNATCAVYRGDDTTLGLLVSSAHPARAGVQADVVRVLARAGAKLDGLADDGEPLWTAITFGYPDAVDALVDCGARVDNLVFAAATGEVARLDLDNPGVVRAATIAPEDMLDRALIYAAGLGRRDVVARLLAAGASRTAVEPLFGSTAIGAARYRGHADVVGLFD